MDYTVVLGVDWSHLQNLKVVLPNWKQHRPELFDKTFVIFFDRESTSSEEVVEAFKEIAPETLLRTYSWPPPNVTYPEGTCKWDNQQRHKMLAGFVHVPPTAVFTPYWLKLDLDVICTQTGAWVQPWWFDGLPAIVAPPWGYTKPIDQMDRLDAWANQFASSSLHPPLNLPRGDNQTMLRHHRICSWLGFFNTEFSLWCSKLAHSTLGYGKIPVPSQDGFAWYMATRFKWGVKRVDIKAAGWDVKANLSKVEKAISCLRDESSI